MIIHLKEDISAKDANKIAEETEGKLIFNDQKDFMKKKQHS